jgi:hypothetical protein
MRTLEDDMLKVRGYLDEAEAHRRQVPAAASPEPSEPGPPAEPPARDQLSLF